LGTVHGNDLKFEIIVSRIKIEEPYSKCVIIIWEGERNNTTYRQYLEEISPYDMYASTKKEVALTVQPIMLKLHTKFQIISKYKITQCDYTIYIKEMTWGS
jgi:hypothetical protein